MKQTKQGIKLEKQMYVAENTQKDDKKAEGATVNNANKLYDRVPLSCGSCGTQF